MVLVVFLTLSAVSASENATLDEVAAIDESPVSDSDLQNSNDNVISANESTSSADVKKEDVKTSLTADYTNVVKGSTFNVRLTDSAGKGISKKPIEFSLNGKTYTQNTDSNGWAKLKIDVSKGTYTISYKFISQNGYKASSGSSKILVVSKTDSKLTPSYTSMYSGVKDKFKVTLTVDGVKLANKKITFKVKGKTYTKYTDSNGVASLALNLAKGKYNIKYSFAGEKNIKKVSKTSKVTFKKGMPTKLKKASSETYYAGVSTPLKVKLTDLRGNPLSGKKIVFKVNKKTYSKKTDKNGVATLKINQKKGSYKVTYTFKKTSAYKQSKGSAKISVKTKPKYYYKGNSGIWIFSTQMKEVNLKTLSNYGVKNIFLHSNSVKNYGKAAVETFIKQAKSNGIKVHIWMQIFYNDGKWVSPVNNDGTYKYDLFNEKIKLAKEYASLKGVAGVHFDYLRFPGTAYKHTNGAAAVSYFTKQCSNAVHGVNKNLIVSAAIMPEPSSMKHYYGQDVSEISKSLDVMIPMVYKGNYNAGTSWITKVTQAFVKQSKGAKVWTGLQTYKSDADVTKLSASALLKDAKAASSGGAVGVVLFRYGLVNMFNFSKL